MRYKRPVHLDLTKIKMPLQAYTSIMHRVSGVFLAVISVFAVYALQQSLESEQSFNELKRSFISLPLKICLLVVFAALNYHLVAGIKHFIMDFGFAETKYGSKIAAIMSILIASVLTVIVGIWLW